MLYRRVYAAPNFAAVIIGVVENQAATRATLRVHLGALPEFRCALLCTVLPYYLSHYDNEPS